MIYCARKKEQAGHEWTIHFWQWNAPKDKKNEMHTFGTHLVVWTPETCLVDGGDAVHEKGINDSQAR
jgi:hypothetical protein